MMKVDTTARVTFHRPFCDVPTESAHNFRDVGSRQTLKRPAQPSQIDIDLFSEQLSVLAHDIRSCSEGWISASFFEINSWAYLASACARPLPAAVNS